MQRTATAGSYRELRRLVIDAGLLEKQPRFYLAHLVVSLALVLGVIAAVIVVGNSWWNIAVAALLALVLGQYAFIGHDGGHRQMFASIKRNDFAVMALSSVFLGFSLSWWMDSHNRHHASPNHETKDPNIDIAPFAFSDRQLQRKRGWITWFVRYQAVLAIPLNSLGFLTKQLESALYVRSQRTSLRYPRLEPVLVVIHLVGYVCLLFLVMSPPLAVAFFATHYALYGLYLGTLIAPNHKGMVMIRGDEQFDFLYMQVLTSRTIRGGPIRNLLYGGLNYQIEHHLFPNMPRNNLPAAVKIIKPYCEEHGIPYHDTGIFEGYWEILRSMHRISAPLRGPAVGSSPPTMASSDFEQMKVDAGPGLAT